MRDPRQLGVDALKKAVLAQLTFYELELAKNFLDNAILGTMVGMQNLNTPGAAKINFKKFTTGKRPSTTKHGDDDNDGTAGFSDVENEYIVTNQMYNIKWYDLERAIQSNFNIDNESAISIGQRIAQEMDYMLWNGNSGLGLTGIKSGAEDAGAPSGVWDIAGKAYDDINEIIGKLRDQGWTGAIDVALTPGLLKILDRFVSDGTTSFSQTYRQWLTIGSENAPSILNGGSIFASSHPFTQATGPATADKKTGATTATNQFVARARYTSDPQVKLAHDLITLNRPAQDKDISKNIKIKYTLKNGFPSMFAYMDAIDAVT